MRSLLEEKEIELQRFKDQMEKLTINGQLMSLGNILAYAAAQHGATIALETQTQNISYTSLYHRACMFSALLKEKGIKEGDAVLVWLENSIEFYIAYFGVLQIGAIVAPLNVYLTEHELTHIVHDASAKLVVTSKDFCERLKESHNTVPIMLIEETINLDSPITMEHCEVVQKDPHALTLLLYTSGTTGLPKGVMISSSNALNNACQAIARIRFAQCRVLCVLPLFHSFTQNACVWTPLIYGCTVILVRKIDRRLLLEGLEKKPDIFLGVPALYGLLCLMKTAPIENISLFVCGADALPDRIRSSFALVYNRKIANGYGMTESSPFISVDLEDITEPTNCVGRPCVHLEIEIRDEQGTVLPQGSIGQLWVKGPNIMLGYYNAQAQTDEVLKDGWLNTGDLAYINKHEKIVISGREKDIIKNKGLMIYPQEIENVIQSHADVLRVGVIGKPDEAGEVPIAIVQIRVDNPAIETELLKMCKERLAPYKVPKSFIIIRHDPPLTATGKMNKKALKKQYLQDEKL